MAKEFNISKVTGMCRLCEQPAQPGEPIMALARITGEELVREDYHLSCWEKTQHDDPAGAADVLGVWRTSVPRPQEKKRLFVDDALLVNFFERLEGQTVPARLRFRYVLALILMRKRLLVYEGMTRGTDGLETWKMRQRGTDRTHAVVDPKLDEDQIAEVSASLGEVMEGDFE